MSGDSHVRDDRAPLPVSSGLISLCVVAGQHQRSADPLQLARALGFEPAAEPSEAQLLLAAQELGLKAKSTHSNWSRLPNNTLPAIAETKGGGYVVLLRVDPDGHVVAGDPRQPRPQRFDREQFEAIWSGKLLLIKSRRDLFAALRAEIQKMHTYEVPEVIAIPVVDGSEAYLGWIDGQLITPTE